MTAGDEGRDHARTPMHWNAPGAAGFTAGGVRPWLPIGDNATRNVAAQREDPGSMLSLCRALNALRSAEFGGRIASYQQLPTPRDVWAYQVDGLVVTANFSGRPAWLDSGPAPWWHHRPRPDTRPLGRNHHPGIAATSGTQRV